MQKLDYNKIQKIEDSANEKLFNYIATVNDFEKLLEEIDFYFPVFNISQNINFNRWLIIESIVENGQTLISKFIEEKSEELSKEEKEILKERDKSNMSLFEIMDIDGDLITILDLLENKTHTLRDSSVLSMINEDDIVFSRIGNILNKKVFIGDLYPLPQGTKDLFLKNIFIDFNSLRSLSPNLTIKKYLKKYSNNVYGIYATCMFQDIGSFEDESLNIYFQLSEFESFLKSKFSNLSDESIDRHISFLIEFFEYFLEDQGLTLYDLDRVDLKMFFESAIEDGFLSSQKYLNAYILTLKIYTKFLNFKDPKYKESYKTMLAISKDRFAYMKKFDPSKPIFEFDDNFLSLILENLNEEAINLLVNLDRFLYHVMENNIEVTKKNKLIKRKHLYNIHNSMLVKDILNKKAPNQKDFPIIHLLFKLTKKLGLLEIKKDTLICTNKCYIYMRLRREEKYSLVFQSIWEEDSISDVFSEKGKKLLAKFRKKLITLFSSKENSMATIEDILSSFSRNPDFSFEYYFNLQYLGLLRCNLYPNYQVKVTLLGKLIFQYLSFRDKNPHKACIVSLADLKKNK